MCLVGALVAIHIFSARGSRVALRFLFRTLPARQSAQSYLHPPAAVHRLAGTVKAKSKPSDALPPPSLAPPVLCGPRIPAELLPCVRLTCAVSDACSGSRASARQGGWAG